MAHPILHLIISIGIYSLVSAFTAPATLSSRRGIPNDDVSTTSLFMAKDTKGLTLYPVLSRIASKNWTGSCKYVGADLIHLSKLKLTGGVRYDIAGRNVTLSSYLTFPDGNTREVVMTGSRDPASSSSVITLRSIEEGGPIRMLMSEVGTDTILINEVEEATGKTILTTSTSIIEGGKLAGKDQLVQVSHEVGEGIDGHQIWRLKEIPYVSPAEADARRDALGAKKKKQKEKAASSEVPVEFNDFDGYIDTTGR